MEFRLRSIVRCDLFPTSEMILSMSKEFGVPFNDLNELFPQENSFNQADIDNLNSINTNDQFVSHNIPHTSRIWTPIDHDNDKYLKEKIEKRNNVKNFMVHNIDSLQEMSEQTK